MCVDQWRANKVKANKGTRLFSNSLRTHEGQSRYMRAIVANERERLSFRFDSNGNEFERIQTPKESTRIAMTTCEFLTKRKGDLKLCPSIDRSKLLRSAREVPREHVSF